MKGNSKMTPDDFKEKHYGVTGTKSRDELHNVYENFKLGALLQEAPIEKGLTQTELGEKVGTTKFYISKIEKKISRKFDFLFYRR